MSWPIYHLMLAGFQLAFSNTYVIHNKLKSSAAYDINKGIFILFCIGLMCTLESSVLSLDFSDILVWVGQLIWFTWTWEGHQTQYFPEWHAKLFDIRQKSVHIDIKHIILYTWVQHQSKTDELVHIPYQPILHLGCRSLLTYFQSDAQWLGQYLYLQTAS